MSDINLLFFTGCNHLAQVSQFSHPVMISVNAFLKKRGRRYALRKSPFSVGDWMLDSGAFSRISRQYGFKNHLSTLKYARIVQKFQNCGNLLAVVAQDYMTEPFILEVTGLDIATHQRLTIHRYDRLKSLLGKQPYIMPVLQGYQPREYIAHIRQYGSRLVPGMWVGVGSVCRRNSRPKRYSGSS